MTKGQDEYLSNVKMFDKKFHDYDEIDEIIESLQRKKLKCQKYNSSLN